MIEIKKRISENLLKIVRDLGVEAESVLVEEPTDFSHGDLTSNIALQVSKELKSNPRDIAEKIVGLYPEDDDIEKIEIAGPGFINISLSDKYLLNILKNVVKNGNESFKLGINSGVNSIIEYTDPNPFKMLHIGHLYTNMVGESLARLQEAVGTTVYRANYQGDVGLHVAKTLYGLPLLLEKDGIRYEDLREKSLVDRVNYLGEAYMLGFNHYDDIKDSKAIEKVKDLNYYIFSLFIPSLDKKDYFKEFEDIGIDVWYREGRQWCLDYFETIYERTGTQFDYYFFESEMSEKGLDIVLENTDQKGKGIFNRDDGSVIYRGDESKGLHTRVFVNSNGLPTYEAKDLALAFAKFEKMSFDESVMITADEQTGYFKVVLDALSQLDQGIASASKHFPHGMIKLPGAEKMSSRKGKIIEGEWLLNETKKRVVSIMKNSGKWQEGEIEQVSERIGVAAVKYSFLKVSIGSDVIFDFDKSISFDGDTGPYLQYVYARCNSLLENSDSTGNWNVGNIENLHTKELLRKIVRFESVLLGSAANYSPSILCTYLFDLGQTFNKFYQNVRVLDSEDREFLLSVVDATAKTMKYGLNTLGIETVDHM